MPWWNQEFVDMPEQLMTGYLLKLSSNGTWQRRFFEVNGAYLTYYKTAKMQKLLAALSIPQLGEIKLMKGDASGLGEYCGEGYCTIRLSLKDKQYYLRAGDETEAQAWARALTAVRDRCRQTASNPLYSARDSRDLDLDDSSVSDQSQVRRPTASVQKATRLDCLSCLRRLFRGMSCCSGFQ